LAAIGFAALSGSATANPDAADYHAAFVIAGLVLRSSTVCPNPNRAIDAFKKLWITGPDFDAFATGYPKTVNIWLKEGSETFNAGVTKDGVGVACDFAQQQIIKIEQEPVR
jgi:hypothetical protein